MKSWVTQSNGEAKITPIARSDLKENSCYTENQWGRKQCLNYLKKPKDRFSYLANNPQRGRKLNEIIGSPYSYHERRHGVLYCTTAEGIEIL